MSGFDLFTVAGDAPVDREKADAAIADAGYTWRSPGFTAAPIPPSAGRGEPPGLAAP
jgi:hypothetical protein